ncbi:hypothetical protein [Paenarthrobacter sp. PH39-S1]|nr:hypothetical protein [Paenarthrobacter sp. PH39-S1]
MKKLQCGQSRRLRAFNATRTTNGPAACTRININDAHACQVKETVE